VSKVSASDEEEPEEPEDPDPLDPLDACAVIARGRARPVDLGEAGTRTFVTIASLGVDSEVNRLAAAAHGPRGRHVYLLAALRATATWRTAAFVVTLDDGRAVRMRGWSVAAANGASYGAGMRLAPGARLDDGTLDVVLIARLSRLGFLIALPSVFLGAHVRLPTVTVLRARAARVEADRPFTVWADGEPVGPLPMTVRAVPAALEVLVP
jgi:diacylglycerol kinase family enzyme